MRRAADIRSRLARLMKAAHAGLFMVEAVFVEPITERVESNVLIIRVEDKSRLNESRPEDFRQKLQEILQNHPEQNAVVLDISPVDFFSSTAIATLVLLKKSVTARSGKLVITGMHPDVRNALEIVKLVNHFQILPDNKAALELLQAS